ncbi:MAG: glycosyltransferase [Hyphomicrobiaceae bacterium]
MTIAIVVGSLAPYTSRVYDAYVERHDTPLHVYGCAAVEPHRQWRIPPPKHMTYSVLPGLRWHRSDASHLYVNPAILSELRRLKPEMIMIGAFSPTMLGAVAYARMARVPYGIATDGTLNTDPGLSSKPHALMRRLMVPGARFGAGGSPASVELLEYWGLKEGLGVTVPVIPSWDAPAVITDYDARPFDILFAGGINERYKGALFFADVMAKLKARGRTFKVRVTGTGPDLEDMKGRLEGAGVTVHFDGAVQPGEIPAIMSSARLFAFPSREDPWGLVANEAVLCGTPVLGSPYATSSPYYVEKFGVGLVRPLEVDAWCTAIEDMLSSRARYDTFMHRRDEAVRWCSLESGVDALHEAFEIGRDRTARSAATRGRQNGRVSVNA